MMQQDDNSGGGIILPPDPWWLLRVEVPKDGDQVPFHIRLLWHYQFAMPKRIDDAPESVEQADGVR